MFFLIIIRLPLYQYLIIIPMNYSLKCAVHFEEPLDLICMCGNCEEKGLICYLCKVENHADHEPVLSLKIFLGELLRSTGEDQDFIRETALIDKELLTLQQKVANLKKKMANNDLIDEAFQKFWREIVSSIAQFDEIIIELRSILKKKDDDLVKDLNTWIRKNGNQYSTQKDEESKHTLYVTFLKGKLDSLINIRQSAEKLESKGNFDDSELLSLFAVQETINRSFKLRFSEELKGTCMTISSPTKASMTVHGNQRMMLLEPSLGITRSIKRWKVKVEKLASWIGVGVAHLDSIKGVNFDFSYTNANHGNYLISSNGYSWNGYKMQFNSKYETPQFTTNDIIEVVYDPINSKVTFKKEGLDQEYSYDVDPNQKPIHAAINMSGVGDAVEILP